MKTCFNPRPREGATFSGSVAAWQDLTVSIHARAITERDVWCGEVATLAGDDAINVCRQVHRQVRARAEVKDWPRECAVADGEEINIANAINIDFGTGVDKDTRREAWAIHRATERGIPIDSIAVSVCPNTGIAIRWSNPCEIDGRSCECNRWQHQHATGSCKRDQAAGPAHEFGTVQTSVRTTGLSLC